MPVQVPEGCQTLVYSVVDNHEIRLDYYLPRATGNLPALIYWHGGGMTAESRRKPLPLWLHKHCLEKGYIFISADYRLCHPSTALDQIEDCKALFRFIAGESFSKALPDSVSLDTTRIAVTGFSAGAYSARAACIYAEPKPAVLMSAYGLGGNMLLDHWTDGRPATSIAKFVDLDLVPALLADKTVVSDDTSTGMLSKRFALTVRWELDGTFLDGVFGKPGLGAALNAVEYQQRPVVLPEEVKPGFLQFFVTEKHPPSVFVHGTADEVVVPQESVDHHEKLTELGVPSKLLLVENGPHGLGAFGADPESELVKSSMRAYSTAMDFIAEVFSAGSPQN